MSDPQHLAASLHFTLNGTLTPADTLTYVHVPFEVPEGIERISVKYHYDAAISSDPTVSGGNTIDIGIFDARGVAFLEAGFRGWSGSARSEFFVGSTSATPGYLPGPIMAGTWHICLGAYKVAPDGCRYRIDIDFAPAATPPVQAFPQRLLLDDRKTVPVSADGWYRGELHCHTVNSDGDSTTAEIVARAEALGLDFLAITDHNNITHQIDLNAMQSPLLLIPGYEVTTYYGHWNIWGDGAWVDFRIQQPADLAQAIAFAQEEGYLVSCNHPRPYGPNWAFPEVDGYRCVEVWNGPWEVLNSFCLDFWEVRLREGQRLVAVGGSDHHYSHQPHIAQLGHPTLWVYVSPEQAPTARKLLEAVRAGHCLISEAPTGARLTLHIGDAMMGDTITRPADDRLMLEITVTDGAGNILQVVGADGVLAERALALVDHSFSIPVMLNGSPYVRAQVIERATGQMRALTNPIYCT